MIKRTIKDLLILIAGFVGLCIGAVIKKKGLIVFSQTLGRYSGNSRILFEYLCESNQEVCWLYESIEQKEKIPTRYHHRLVKRSSLQGTIIALKSKWVVLSYATSDFGNLWWLLQNKKVLNLWHAIMMKHVATLDEKFSNVMIERYLKNEIKYYNAMTVSSDIDRYLTSSSHGIDVRKVYALGNPKQDQYLRNYKNRKQTPEKKVLYAPTFRDYALEENLFFPFNDFNEQQLRELFANNESLKIYLRPHPNDKSSVIQADQLEKKFPKNVVHFSQSICDDVDEVMHEFDVIISDYSSIYVEPLLGNTPCIFVPFDYERYVETRGLPYDYNLVTPGPKVSTYKEFEQALGNALNGAPEWAQQRNFVADIFFKYKDTNACKRIAEQVLGLTIGGE